MPKFPDVEMRYRFNYPARGGGDMPKNFYLVLYVAVMAAVIVGVDLLFFRNRLLPRLMANIGIVLIFGAFYFRFLKNL